MSKRLIINILAGILIFFPTISWGELYHTVSADETLWRIAKKYNISVEELRQINGLNGNLICSGQRLCVAVEKSGVREENVECRRQETGGTEACRGGFQTRPSQTGTKEAGDKEQKADIVQGTILHSQKSYVVKKGDTLFSIARRNGCTVDKLKRLNHLVNNTIEIDQVLVFSASTPGPQGNEASTFLAETAPSGDDAHLAEEASLGDDAIQTDVLTAKKGDPPAKEATLAEEHPPAVEEKYLEVIDSTATTDIQFSENPGAIVTQIVDAAKRYLYVPYKSGGEIGDEATDCSGFVKRTFASFGIILPRSAREQWGKGSPVTELQEGDLVFFATYASYPSHVGIYIGGDRFIHSSSYRSGGVRIDSLDSPYYHQRYLGARRMVALE
ncbi:LysM peptidoglycan-binding domain-containing protein [Candidatus Desantisbacteria bacterium]|nr:LysM peptidoglycan-binding domain-containing protein [Candidatus Desantisbacteria bacterium]